MHASLYANNTDVLLPILQAGCKGTVGRQSDIGRIDIYWVMYKIKDESLGVRALGIRGEYIYMWPVSL
jgi:hypothetical protein